jgi:hypothetical protein
MEMETGMYVDLYILNHVEIRCCAELRLNIYKQSAPPRPFLIIQASIISNTRKETCMQS